MNLGTALDHVAIATRDITATLRTVVGELGGFVMHGGDGYGFRWVQVRLGTGATGMTIELLVVWQPTVNDFLERFVDRHGPGVHHMTFKVKDLAATLDRCAALGLDPVGVNLDDPQWREAFIQPRHAHGTVVQLAQTSEDWSISDTLAAVERTGETTGTPIWWPTPPPRSSVPVTLQRAVLGSPDRSAATEFFAGLLSGAIVRDDHDATELLWPGGGRVQLIDADHAGFVRLEGFSESGTGTESGTDVTIDLGNAPIVVRRH